MSRFFSHVNTAKTILELYKGEMPFSAFLKNFFSKEKKYGSRDRRVISSLCYNYFRIGHALINETFEERLLLSSFFCTEEPSELLQKEKPLWYEKATLPLSEKLLIAGVDVNSIFPFNNELSNDIDVTAFNTSFLIQPKLFVRIRPRKKPIVLSKLVAAQITFEEINEMCLAFANGTKLENVLDINHDAVIQDLNSQRVSEFILNPGFEKTVKVWDCCAASGGKSMMAYDKLQQIELTVSDVRQSIIQNLHKRFKDAGIRDYKSFVTDVTDAAKLRAALGNKRFGLIICDAPCSGSGTWARTPEQLLFFKKEEITRYSNLQKRIATNAIPYLQKAGYFLYITCSVFEKENENVVEFIKQNSNLVLIKMELLKGYDNKADSMFSALFQLP